MMRRCPDPVAEGADQDTPMRLLRGKGSSSVLFASTFWPRITSYLDSRSRTQLSRCSHVLFKRATSFHEWRDKLIAIGCNPAVVRQLGESGAILNYQKLFRIARQVSQCLHIKTEELVVWQLCCLSGEVLAIQHVINVLQIPRTILDDRERSMLHYAVMSGSVAAMQYVNGLRIPLKHDTDLFFNNALHLAAQCGSVSGMEYAVNVLRVSSTSRAMGRNALHFAVSSGVFAAVEYAVDILHISPTSEDGAGVNALDYAISLNFIEAISYLRLQAQISESPRCMVM